MITTFNIVCWRYENHKLKTPAVSPIILPKIELCEMKDSFKIEFDASYVAQNQNTSNYYYVNAVEFLKAMSLTFPKCECYTI